ncbi:hypothetical protein V1514DRAFT_265471, partial [Lipomyces japonicus]|uniref:uncharacterized protein n=1 Tax=Lipomyces japonicus TaxID=56871 RepID=UPI0034CFB7EC
TTTTAVAAAAQAAAHLANLQRIDEQIVSLLGHASAALATLNSTTTTTTTTELSIPERKEKFKTETSALFAGLESATVGLRQEVAALQDANMLAMVINSKAESVGIRHAHESVRDAEIVLQR